MEQQILTKIISQLKEDSTFEIGEYERIYPDTLQTTKGIYTIIVQVYGYYEVDYDWDSDDWDDQKWKEHINSFKFSNGSFDVKGIEGSFELDEFSSSLWIYENTSEKAFWDKVESKLNQFKTYEDLKKEIVKTFNFDIIKSKLNVFNMIKDDLPDGTNFEQFCEGGYL